MKTKNIFKALALAMLLTTACVNNEIPNEKGYKIPVTVNVTRQGDDAGTKATYNGTTHKLEFSTGDKLFVMGYYNSSTYSFAGTLDYDAVSGKFKGTILTQDEYLGTDDDLFTEANTIYALLLPDGYSTRGYLVINNPGTYYASTGAYPDNSFALTKAEAVEQLSRETASSYSSGFALAPSNAILNFTITGLTASTEYAVALSDGYVGPTRNVTTDGSGNATFAVGVSPYYNLNELSLTVDGNAIALGSHALVAGKIYNIYRDVTATRVDLSTISGYYEVTEDVILTGTPAADLTIANNDGYTVTLDNVNPEGTVAVKMNANDFTLKLKGTSKLTWINSVGHALTIGEAVAGGTVIINNSSYALRAATVTVNGGTVKAKSTASNYAVWGNLEVNGGAVYLAGADGYNAVSGTITGTLYGWGGTAWGAATGVQYVTTDNSAAPTSWTW